MNGAGLIAALNLPPNTLVDQRISKKLLVEHAPDVSGARRRVEEGIEEVHWVAALKPGNSGIPAYKDDEREYVEIAVMVAKFREGAKATRLAEFIHRAIPYPVVLASDDDEGPSLSVAHKRWSHATADETVLEGDLVSVVCADSNEAALQPFVQLLDLARQPTTSLLSVYDGWMDAIYALRAARITGEFRPADGWGPAAARREALGKFEQLEAEIATLTAAAKKEQQIGRQIAYNLRVQELRKAKEGLRVVIGGEPNTRPNNSSDWPRGP